MAYHILTGDCLADNFSNSRIPGEMIVCRECLVEGPVKAIPDHHFWEARAQYLSRGSEHEKEFYVRAVKGEFDKIGAIDRGAEVCLWFEHDLFCQVNYWFTIALLKGSKFGNVYRVLPQTVADRKWDGYGSHSAQDLEVRYANRVRFTGGD